MAKVEGPLFSLEARGKVGNVMVHFPWKGRNVVRKWLKPTNPRDIDQKLIRQKLAAIGKVLGVIVTPGTVSANGSLFVQGVKTLTPAAQIWNAWLVKLYMQDLACDVAWSLFMTCIAQTSVVTAWQSNAEVLELATIATGDAFATQIAPEEQLAAMAYAAWKAEYSDVSVNMSVHPANMAIADVSFFASNLVTDAV